MKAYIERPISEKPDQNGKYCVLTHEGGFGQKHFKDGEWLFMHPSISHWLQPVEIAEDNAEAISHIINLINLLHYYVSGNRYSKEHLAILEAAIFFRDAAAKPQDKDLIIHGLEEGAENWKSEYDNCRALLQELVYLKSIKDIEEYKDQYESRKPKAWAAAKEFLSKYQHL